MPVQSSLNPFTAAAIEWPYDIHVELRRRGIVYVEEIDTWIASRYADVDAVLMDQVHFTAKNAAGGGARMVDPEFAEVYSKGWPMVRTLMTADPPQHRWYRMMLSPEFTPRSVRAMDGFVEGVVDRLIDGFYSQGRVDVASELALPLPLIVFCTQMGVPAEDLPLITQFTNDFNDSFTFEIADLGRDRELELVRSVVDFQHYAWNLIQRRKAELGDDLLSHMITHTIRGGLERPPSDLELLSTVMLLLNAGTETTMNLIGSCALVLLERPELADRIRGDASQVAKFVEEVLRFESPVQSLFRTATARVDIGGVTIPAGARVAVLYGAANRDPDAWDDPDVFDIDRTDGSKGMHFGKGEHFCLGAHLARLEATKAVGRVLDRLSGLRLADDHQTAYRRNPLTRGLASLNVEWDVD